ncbi:sugar transporter [Penicillium herquei]|nr:sugar transporter [Penicillium herquei]
MLSSSERLSWLQTSLITAPAFILYGYNQSGLSALLKLPTVVQMFPQIDTINTYGSQKSTNSTIEGLVNGCLQLGALVGALSCSIIGDRLGRRKSIFLAGILAGIGQILQCTAFSLPQLIIGRVILGFGVGQLNVTVPVWQAESSNASQRGRKWRLPLAIPVILSLLVCCTIFSLPESPRWLVQKNQISRAKEALAQLNGVTISIVEIFRGNSESRLVYRFILCMAIQTLQQLVGGSLISIYTTTIFQDNLHLQGDIPEIVAASSLTWKFLCSFIAFVAVDRLGRRSLLVFSGTGMCLCMVVMAVTNSLPDSNHSASIISAVMIFLFNLFYPIGFLGGNFLYCAEIAPVRLRVAMASVSTANHWLWNFIIAMISPLALSSIGWKYYLVFVATCASVPVIVLPFFPETMGRNLELIDRVFSEAPTIWDIVPMARKIPKGDVLVADAFNDKKDNDEQHEHKEFV